MDGGRALVVVGVCTCRNPAGLTKLLMQLAATAGARPPRRVIVVDNDPAKHGIAAVIGPRDKVGFEMSAVFEPQAGIPFARNRLIEEACQEEFEFLAMIDDDEYPAAGWLDAMIAAAMTSGADIVGGRSGRASKHRRNGRSWLPTSKRTGRGKRAGAQSSIRLPTCC